MSDEAGEESKITFWNKYATRRFLAEETLLLIGVEASWNDYGGKVEKQLNLWFSGMILECRGEYAEHAL